jgi:hypothetical protein
LELQQPAVTTQRPLNKSNDVFCDVRANFCACNKGKRYVITKQQQNWKRKGVFYVVRMEALQEEQVSSQSIAGDPLLRAVAMRGW